MLLFLFYRSMKSCFNLTDFKAQRPIMLIIFPEKLSFAWIAVALQLINLITFSHSGYSANKWIFKWVMKLKKIISVYHPNKTNYCTIAQIIWFYELGGWQIDNYFCLSVVLNFKNRYVSWMRHNYLSPSQDPSSICFTCTTLLEISMPFSLS